ncbi:MAG: glycosyltransferase [Proteobacteria bacterium]|nr:glycosyltransferase [Pseudomonadota bacterium]
MIAETEFLKKEIAAYWRVPLDRIAVVDLGVDRKLFHPIDQGAAREVWASPQDATLLMYVGVLDRTHNLEPAIRAAGSADAGIELHVIGDGVRRAEYESLAASARARVVFHGKVEHERVPWFIAAADLCLAPYDSAAFSSGELGYSTMKIPEYLSVGRAVVSVPSGRIRTLVKEGETGFLFANEPESWARFLRALPSRDRLREMGESAAALKLTSWEDTALGYLSLCESALAAQGLRGERNGRLPLECLCAHFLQRPVHGAGAVLDDHAHFAQPSIRHRGGRSIARNCARLAVAARGRSLQVASAAVLGDHVGHGGVVAHRHREFEAARHA